MSLDLMVGCLQMKFNSKTGIHPCLVASSLPCPCGESSKIGFSSKTGGFLLKSDEKNIHDASTSYGALEVKKGNPLIMLAVITPRGLVGLSSVLFRNRIIFIGQPINSQIKPKVGTVCFGVAASQGALLFAGGEKGMYYVQLNARIIIPQSGCGAHVEDVRHQVNEAFQFRLKIDSMYAAFTGQPLEKVQQYTERNHFLSVSKALEFGLIDGVLETEH